MHVFNTKMCFDYSHSWRNRPFLRLFVFRNEQAWLRNELWMWEIQAVVTQVIGIVPHPLFDLLWDSKTFIALWKHANIEQFILFWWMMPLKTPLFSTRPHLENHWTVQVLVYRACSPNYPLSHPKVRRPCPERSPTRFPPQSSFLSWLARSPTSCRWW